MYLYRVHLFDHKDEISSVPSQGISRTLSLTDLWHHKKPGEVSRKFRQLLNKTWPTWRKTHLLLSKRLALLLFQLRSHNFSFPEFTSKNMEKNWSSNIQSVFLFPLIRKQNEELTLFFLGFIIIFWVNGPAFCRLKIKRSSWVMVFVDISYCNSATKIATTVWLWVTFARRKCKWHLWEDIAVTLNNQYWCQQSFPVRNVSL